MFVFFFQNLCKNVPIFIMDLFRFFCLFLLFYELRYVDSVMFSKNQLQIFSNFFFLILSICCNLHDRLSHTELTLFFFAKFLSLYGRLLIGHFSCLFFFSFLFKWQRDKSSALLAQSSLSHSDEESNISWEQFICPMWVAGT